MRYAWILSIVFVLLLLLTPFSSADWFSSNHDFQNTNSTSDNGPEPPLKTLWTVGEYELVMLNRNPPPVIHGNYVYDGYNNVRAINKTTGKIIWTNGNGGHPCDIIYYKGVLYVIGLIAEDNNYRVAAINATTGKTIWALTEKSFNPPNKYIIKNNHTTVVYHQSNPSYTGFIWNNKFVIAMFHASINGETLHSINVTFLNLKNGKIIKNVEVAKISPSSVPYLIAAYGYGNIYIQTQFHLFCVNLTTLKVVWSKFLATIGYMRTNLIVGHGKVFAVVPHFFKNQNAFNRSLSSIPLNTTIVALNAFTGKVLWKFETRYGTYLGTMFSYSQKYDMILSYTLHGHFLVDNGYEAINLYNITAINGTTGKVIWSTQDPRYGFTQGSIVATPKWVYVEGSEFDKKNRVPGFGVVHYWTTYTIRIYNITNGKCIYRYPLKGTKTSWFSDPFYTYSQISVSDGVIYMGGGWVYAIGHGENKNNTTIPIGASIVAGIIGVSIVTGTIFIIRKRAIHKVANSHLKE